MKTISNRKENKIQKKKGNEIENMSEEDEENDE